VSLRGISGSVVVANNALYSQNGRAFFVNGGTSGLMFEGNVGIGGVSDGSLTIVAGDLSADCVDASFVGEPPMDVFPALGGALEAAGSDAQVATDDFNGTLRNGVADVGAYAYSADGNPGWALDNGFKASAPTSPGTGGTGGGSGGAGGAHGGSGGSGGGGSSGCAVGFAGDGSAPPWDAALLASLALCIRRRRRGAV